MPRAVFQLLWSYLDQGKPFAGFVKNMAADGCYYWVMALVVPIDGGYLSVRLKPSSAYFRVVRDLYTELLNIERAAGEAIGSLGFASYDEFMRIALAAGISGHREAQRAFAASGHEPEAVTADLAPTLGSCAAVEHGLDDLFSRVDRLLATISSSAPRPPTCWAWQACRRNAPTTWTRWRRSSASSRRRSARRPSA